MEKKKVLISFDLPNDYIEKIRKVSPSIAVVQSKDKDEALRLIDDADILLAGFFSKELFLAARRLKWIQAWGAGVERFLIPEVVESKVIVTSAGGIHPAPVSEHVLGLMLCFCRKLHLFIRNQAERLWERYDSGAVWEQVEELRGKTVGIVGLGRIGTEIARTSKCLGMRVIATKRSTSGTAPTYVDQLVQPSDLNRLLAEADFVVLSLPLTHETLGMIGKTQLRNMKRTGRLINVSRGKIVQERQLIDALKHGWIAGAGLDTFENEPLPQSSELWAFKNVIITPHVAGQTPHYMERLTSIFCENLDRFLHEQPLINVADKTLGY
jgi:D-2-hydroxyacid dehydrogenase (NADP+)